MKSYWQQLIFAGRDVPPPDDGVRGIEAYEQTWPDFFAWQQSAVFEIVSMEVTAGDDVAFAFALLRCGTPEELAPHFGGGTTVYAVEGGDHSYKVPKRAGQSQEQVHESVLGEIERWVRALSG